MMNATEQNDALVELDQTEAAIATVSACLVTLQTRHAALTRTLDDLTSPPPMPKAITTRTIFLGLEYRGQVMDMGTYIDVHKTILGRLWVEFPERREDMAAAVGRCGSVFANTRSARQCGERRAPPRDAGID